jgi:hypothetical protein
VVCEVERVVRGRVSDRWSRESVVLVRVSGGWSRVSGMWGRENGV